MSAKSVLVIVFLGLVYSSMSAPVMEADNTTPQEPVKTHAEKYQTADKINSETPLSATEKPVKSESDENQKEDVNKEVTNYQTIERDSKSTIQEIDDTNEIDDEGSNLLTDEEARELLLELSDPDTIAQFIVESDDAQGFLQALRLLKDQNYISLEFAYYLRDQVMDRLQRMLMIQEMDLSRTLLNNYEPAELTPDQLPNGEPPAPYYDYNAYGELNNDFYSQDLTPYDESITDERSQALNEIAEAVAQKIAKGELTPDNGVKILDTVADLLPNNYWENEPEMFAEENSLYPVDESYQSPNSDYSELLESIDSDLPNNEDVINGEDDFEEPEQGEEGYSKEDEEEPAEEVEDTDELENELKNRNDLIENALEKQLVDTAQNRDNIVRPFGTEDSGPNIDELGKVDNMTEEDYQAFFDWLETEMNELPLDLDDLDRLFADYESSKEDEHFKNGS